MKIIGAAVCKMSTEYKYFVFREDEQVRHHLCDTLIFFIVLRLNLYSDIIVVDT